MQTETLNQIKQQIVLLDPESKRELADFLHDTLEDNGNSSAAIFSDADRHAQTEWLKTNREKYAHKYVALEGSELAGVGATFAEAKDAAAKNGFPNAFVTYVFSETDEVFGGW